MVEFIAARQDELERRMDSVPRLTELLVKHEDRIRRQDEGEDLVEEI